jgi:hypothetical protein
MIEAVREGNAEEDASIEAIVEMLFKSKVPGLERPFRSG